MRVTLRVACCGAQGTGRSPTALALADALKVPYLPEFAIKLATERHVDARELRHRPEEYRLFETDVIEAQIAAEMQHPQGFVADRSVLDAMAYWSYWVTPYVDAAVNRTFRDRVLSYVDEHPYDVLVLPGDGESPDDADGARTHDPLYQRTIQSRIVGIVLRHAGNAIVVRASGDIPQRVATVLRELES